MHILAEMAKTLAEPRKEISKYAPRIQTVKINPKKIGALIGPAARTSSASSRNPAVKLTLEDDGTVNIFSVSPEGMKIALDAITGMTAEAEIGKIYRGKVVNDQGIRLFCGIPARQGRPWCTSANWPISASSKPKTSSRSAMTSRSNASGWTKRAGCVCRARPAMEDRDKEAAGKEEAGKEAR